MTQFNLDQNGPRDNGDKWWWVLTAVLAVAGPGQMLARVAYYFWVN